jgi:hypothetical protein
MTRDEMRHVIDDWPKSLDSREGLRAARSALNNLSGYPHDLGDELVAWVNVSSSDLVDLLDRLPAGE